MISLLNSRARRLITILETLVQDKDYLNIEEISKINECSKKTAYNDVNYLIKRWGHLLAVEETHQHLKFNRLLNSTLVHIKFSLYQEDLMMIFFYNVLCNPKNNLLDHSVLLNVSETYLNRMIIRWNIYLKKFRIQVIRFGKERNLCVYGKSYNDQISFISEFLRITGFQDDYIHNRMTYKQINFLKLEIGSILSKHKILNNDDSIESLLSFVAIDQGINDTRNLSTIDTLPISLSRLTNQIENSIEIFNSYENINEVVKKTAELLKLNLSPIEMTHLKSIMLKHFILHQIKPTIIEEHLNRFRLFKMKFIRHNPHIKASIDNLINYYMGNLNFGSDGLISQFVFEIYTELPSQNNYQKIKVLIHSDLGQKHEATLIQFYQKHFNYLEYYSYSKNQATIDEVDIFITNNYIDFNNNYLLETKILFSSDFPANVELEQLYNYIYLK